MLNVFVAVEVANTCEEVESPFREEIPPEPPAPNISFPEESTFTKLLGEEVASEGTVIESLGLLVVIFVFVEKYHGFRVGMVWENTEPKNPKIPIAINVMKESFFISCFS